MLNDAFRNSLAPSFTDFDTSAHNTSFRTDYIAASPSGIGGAHEFALHFGQPADLTHNLSFGGAGAAPALAVHSESFHGAQLADSPSMADEIAFLSGIDSSGNVVGTSFWTWRGNDPATYQNVSDASKWGVNHASDSEVITLNYFFKTNSHWTATEQGVFQQCLALWSAVSNVHFNLVTQAADAQVTFVRGHNGSAYETDSPTGGPGAGEIGGSVLSTKTSALISVDTSVPGFGPIDGSFTAFGGYVWNTLVHEMGHLLGLGHAGSYNGNVDPTTQQQSAYDTRLWSIMSYIKPSDHAKYEGDYPVLADWGHAPGGGTNTATTWMPLDIIAVQGLYGAPLTTPLSGGQIFGFNTNIGGDLSGFFDFTVNVNPVVTLWDAGTGNTFDLSGFSTASTVDLNPGTFSSCDGKLNNVAIAFDTSIETAIGGKGNDTFIANSLADTLIGNNGTDTFDFGANLAADDKVDGGKGLDTLVLDGDYAALVFGAATLVKVEAIQLAAGHDYSLTMNNGNVSGANTMTVDGSALGSGDVLTFNGAAEKTGAFVMMGGSGNDALTGGNGGDTLIGGLGGDTLTPGNGADTLKYNGAGDSTGALFDTVVGFDFAAMDHFDLTATVNNTRGAVTGGLLTTANFDTNLQDAIGESQMAGQEAVLFRPTSGDYHHATFLIVDGNGTAGYQGGEDFVFLLTGSKHIASFDAADFVSH